MSEANTKRGPLSRDDKRFIAEMIGHLTASQIAGRLNRPVSTIEKYAERELGRKTIDGVLLPEETSDIENRPYWAELRSQFSDEELRLFAFHWKEVRNQFNDDIFYTEELQIIELCRLEILANRVLREQHASMLEANTIESQLSNDTLDATEKKALLNRLDTLRIAQNAFSKEYREIYDKKTKVLQELKATRRERIKRIEDQKQTVQGWMAAIVMNEPLRERLADYAERHRLAAEKEYGRLSAYYRYADGQVDRVLLTPETALLDNKEVCDGE